MLLLCKKKKETVNYYTEKKKKVLKHLKENDIPYVEAERKKIGNPVQFVLLIWEVFRG